MGGLLAVNQGSIDPPTFSIMEWKPKEAVNKQAIVLVGKGIVYDTGGLSSQTHAQFYGYDEMRYGWLCCCGRYDVRHSQS